MTRIGSCISEQTRSPMNQKIDILLRPDICFGNILAARKGCEYDGR